MTSLNQQFIFNPKAGIFKVNQVKLYVSLTKNRPSSRIKDINLMRDFA
jgi:hypothetical protein